MSQTPGSAPAGQPAWLVLIGVEEGGPGRVEASRREQLQETRVSQLRGAPRQSWGKGRSKGLAKLSQTPSGEAGPPHAHSRLVPPKRRAGGTEHKKMGGFWEYQHLGTANMETEREPSGPIDDMVQTATAKASLCCLETELRDHDQ